MAERSLVYGSTQIARSGRVVPLFLDGTPSNSLYDPEREGRQTADSLPQNSFVFFAGICGGYHIRSFLASRPEARCVVCDGGSDALDRLSALIDIADILENPRVTVLREIDAPFVAQAVSSAYLPAAHGDFRFFAPRIWQEKNFTLCASIRDAVAAALRNVSADYSTQAHFGRIWFRNAFINLRFNAAGSVPLAKKASDARRAVVAAAGPGLEDFLPVLTRDREQYAIFATDTAFGPLARRGIAPDYFVSVDAQSVSAAHAAVPFSPATTVILDVCGNPDIAIRASSCGSPVALAAGGHPLARWAANRYGLPIWDTSSGTVTGAALDAALSLGYRNPLVSGADFAYVCGKPYARGTYLESRFGAESTRLAPSESKYSALMFRTPVTRIADDGGITYRTETLDRYAAACEKIGLTRLWGNASSGSFPFAQFLGEYTEALTSLRGAGSEAVNLEGDAAKTLLPLAAWFRASAARSAVPFSLGSVINLALELIAGYTR